MFSLIITIISIALVVALVAATMYYGGSALNQGTVRADASGFLAGAQQISAALNMHEIEGKGNFVAIVAASSDTDFVTALIDENYLATVPTVKSADVNVYGAPATSSNSWVLHNGFDWGTRYRVDPLTGVGGMVNVTGSVLEIKVANPDVCAKLERDGNVHGDLSGIYDCDPGTQVFRFHMNQTYGAVGSTPPGPVLPG